MHIVLYINCFEINFDINGETDIGFKTDLDLKNQFWLMLILSL